MLLLLLFPLLWCFLQQELQDQHSCKFSDFSGKLLGNCQQSISLFRWGKALFLLLLSSKVMSTIALALLLTLGKWRPPAERLQPAFRPHGSGPPPSTASILRPSCGRPVGVVGSLVYRSTYASLSRAAGHFSGHCW